MEKTSALLMMENGEKLGYGERGQVDGQAGGEEDNWSKDDYGAGTTYYAEDSGREGGVKVGKL